VSFTIAPGEAFGLVGESGSGKSLTCRAILRLMPRGATISGRISYGSRNLLALGDREMQALRGSSIAMVFQDPLTALNPVLRVGDSIAQVIQAHGGLGRRAARMRAIEMMERVGIRDAGRRAPSYPHEFSGGMRQRIHIAMALAARPTLLLADEPTTALDVVVQAEILRLLDDLRRQDGMSLLLVSHDFRVVAGLCDRVGVMYAGELVEVGRTDVVLRRPEHPYTIGLMNSLPEAVVGERLRAIPGAPPEPGSLPPGCAFAPRCELARDSCTTAPIAMAEAARGHWARCIRRDQLDELRRGLVAVGTAGA
jgi:oligopeptide/dipeptide ABC transporter ATP-binding protein